MVMDTTILLLLGALLLSSVYLIYKQIDSGNKLKNRYIDALERQIKENNQDISILGKRLADASQEVATVGTVSRRRPAHLNPSTLKPSSQGDLLVQLSIIESKLVERDQQIKLLQIEISRYQHQKKILLQRDEEINTLSADLAQTSARLNDALIRLKKYE